MAYVLRLWVYDPAANPNIKLLIRAFRLERLMQRRIMPKWELHLVILALMRLPFALECDIQGETSYDVIPLKWRTMKTVPARINWLQRDDALTFMKKQLPSQAPEWISSPGIAHLNPSEAEGMLCPVRQLKLYLRDSERIHGGRQRLFIHWNHNIRDIMRSHISRWIVETVTEAYTLADTEYDRVTAHEVRALSASWAYNCQVALPDILSAAFWRSSGVFQNSYLRDMVFIADGMSTLGPMVVAQQVMDPGHLHPPP